MVLPSLRADTFITCGRTCMRIRKQRGVSWGGQDPGRERERRRRQESWALAVSLVEGSLQAEAECGTGRGNFRGDEGGQGRSPAATSSTLPRLRSNSDLLTPKSWSFREPPTLHSSGELSQTPHLPFPGHPWSPAALVEVSTQRLSKKAPKSEVSP